MANAALHKQAEQVAILDVRTLSCVTDYFVIATATTRRQVSAIVEHVTDELARVGKRVWHVEGLPASAQGAFGSSGGDGVTWTLIDCGDCVVHLFDPPGRTLYQLEHLWADATRIPLDPAGAAPPVTMAAPASQPSQKRFQ